jgi:hypothetical protein
MHLCRLRHCKEAPHRRPAARPARLLSESVWRDTDKTIAELLEDKKRAARRKAEGNKEEDVCLPTCLAAWLPAARYQRRMKCIPLSRHC